MDDIVASHTNIPVPKVLDWNSNDNNPIGTEYVIMEHVPGVQLHEIWPTMNTHQHMLVTKALAKAIVEMASIPFPAYGSLYFANARIEERRKVDLRGGFVIGPHCGREYWPSRAGTPREKQKLSEKEGPCG